MNVVCIFVVCVIFVVGIVLYLPVYSFDEGCGESIVFCYCLYGVPFFLFFVRV